MLESKIKSTILIIIEFICLSVGLFLIVTGKDVQLGIIFVVIALAWANKMQQMDKKDNELAERQQAPARKWVKAERQWCEYPIGTRARCSWEGGYWEKTECGWQWWCGSTFPYPGCADQVEVPLPVSHENKS